MALAKGAADSVLPGQPDRDPAGNQSGKRQRLGVAPVDGCVRFVKCIATPLQGTLQFRMQVEPLGKRQERLIERLQLVPSHLGSTLPLTPSLSQAGGASSVRVGGVGRLSIANAFANPLELVQARLQKGFRFACANDAASNQVRRVMLADRRLLFD